MTNVILGVDLNNYEEDAQTQQYIAGLLEKAGFSVQTPEVGPNPTQTYCMEQAKGDEVAILMCNGIAPVTFADFGTGAGTYYHITKFIEAGQGWIQGPGWCDDMKNKGADEHDFNGPASFKAKWNLKTLDEVADSFGRDKLDWCCANTKEDLANAIIACINGTGGTTTVQGGSGVFWPDKTFWGLLRQITGAVDAIFIIANNMAYMLSFKDFYAYRDRYEEFIPELPANHIINNTLEKNWSTEGFYNTVVVDYDGGRIQYEYEPLVKQYGRQPFFYEFPDDDEETAKAKADALLGAHIRDYSLDIHLTCIYNKQITVGSWVKVPKKITKINYERVLPALGGTNFEGEEKKQVNEKSDEVELEYDLLFVQGYYTKWTSEKSLIMDLHLKYAPDTPEDPVNATVGGGGVAVSTSGSYGNDCFTIAEFTQLEGDRRIPHDGTGAVEYARANSVPDSFKTPRAKQGSSYDKEFAGMTSQEACLAATKKKLYCCYADFCSLYECADDLWSSPEPAYNCGDWMRMGKVICDLTGVTCWGFHIDGHYFCMIETNGSIESLDLSRRHDPNTNTCGWPLGPYVSTGCSCRTC